MNAVTIKFDATELNEALRRLNVVSDKLPSELVNQKGHRIFQKAAQGMKKVEAQTIESELGATPVHMLVKLKSGKFSRSKKHIKMFFGQGEGDEENFPLAAAIIQSRAKREGRPSPWKGVSRAVGAQQMLEAMQKLYGQRQKSRGFYRATFAVIRNIFKRASNRPSGLSEGGDSNLAVGSIDSRKGVIADAAPAQKNKPTAVSTFWLRSPLRTASYDTEGGIPKYVEPVLQAAVDAEAKSTFEHAAEKEYKDAIKALGIKVS